MNNLRKGFTLIELLVVIAIIAILAAILFPVFAQAKQAAKKTSDLSNQKQIGTAMYLYATDADDTTPCYKWDGFYAIAAKVLPYTKNKDLFRSPNSVYKFGSVQQRVGFNPYGNFMVAPNDGCVGLGTSTAGAANAYNDIYPALDYNWNDSVTAGGSSSASCSGGFDLGMSMTDGKVTNVAKVVMWYGFPTIGTQWPGGCVDGVCAGEYGVSASSPTASFWGTNFKGQYMDGSNVVHLDSHAKYYKGKAMYPTLHEVNQPWGVPRTDVKAWGFNWADPSVQ